MWPNIFQMFLSLLLILASCELFTNSIEWLGKKLRVGDGVVGSLFSAVGTCLPETMIPIIAILFFRENNSIDIGIGAIIGAPFMLSTLAFFVTGISVVIFWRKRRTGMSMGINREIVSRDICFFIAAYTLGISSAFINIEILRTVIALFLISIYIYYIFLTVKQDKIQQGPIDKLYFSKIFHIKPRFYVIMLQVCLALLGIIIGADIFVVRIEAVSALFGIPAIVLSLVITPIATELPEKFNSIIWISKSKDALALGNITGAMVFQSCIPVSIGILSTDWSLNSNAVISALIAVMSASVVYFWMENRKSLNPIPLIMGGFFYTVFICTLFYQFAI
ncbi:sodium:calcium antiporter [Acetivibrio cellulolyticus]|uniref:sodium:calcium antiporter n=1 Tax=Acetivibrio cellulolyticus TaxID=35830 RepID=UPI00047480EB